MTGAIVVPNPDRLTEAQRHALRRLARAQRWQDTHPGIWPTIRRPTLAVLARHGYVKLGNEDGPFTVTAAGELAARQLAEYDYGGPRNPLPESDRAAMRQALRDAYEGDLFVFLDEFQPWKRALIDWGYLERRKTGVVAITERGCEKIGRPVPGHVTDPAPVQVEWQTYDPGTDEEYWTLIHVMDQRTWRTWCGRHAREPLDVSPVSDCVPPSCLICGNRWKIERR